MNCRGVHESLYAESGDPAMSPACSQGAETWQETWDWRIPLWKKTSVKDRAAVASILAVPQSRS